MALYSVHGARDSDSLPGADLIREGLRDLDAGVESVPALLVLVGAARLRDAGIDVVDPFPPGEYPEHRVELASPDDFIPPLPGWQDRSPFILRDGMLPFHHYDFYAQALANIERANAIDRRDVQQMIGSGLVHAAKLLELFSSIESEVYRYPAIDTARFRRAVESVARTSSF